MIEAAAVIILYLAALGIVGGVAIALVCGFCLWVNESVLKR